MTAEWATALGTITMAIGACLGGWSAIRGVNAWHDEVVGRRKAELAEEVLAQFYRARDVLVWARLPAEGARIEPAGAPGHAPSLSSPVERLTVESQLFSELQASRYRFMAYFGQTSARPFDEVRAIHSEVVRSVEALARDAGALDVASNHRRKVLRQTIGWGGSDEDELSRRLDNAIAAIEGVCRPLIHDPARPASPAGAFLHRLPLQRLRAWLKAEFAGPNCRPRKRRAPDQRPASVR